jgi:hypothetical protein
VKGSNSFVLHLAISGVALPLICVLASFLVGLPFQPSNRFVDYFFFGPTFAVPILLGIAVGWRLGPSMSIVVLRTLYVPVVAIFAWSAISTLWYEPGNFARVIYDTYFGINCGSSECLDQLLVTLPLVSVLSYTLGSYLARHRSSHAGRANGRTARCPT